MGLSRRARSLVALTFVGVLVSVSLSDGAVRAWNLTRERDALAP